MVIGLSLGLLGLLGIAWGAKKLSDSYDGGSVKFSPADLSSEGIQEAFNNSDFAEKYQNDSVLTAESEEPFISSAEISRPSSGFSGKDPDHYKRKKNKAGFGSGFVAASVLDFLGDVSDDVSDVASGSPSLFWLLVLGGVGYFVYRSVK